ncbi:MAG: hypothetical protein ACLFSZ_10770, partial [Puniceicoccaceae bacterium]
MKHLLLPALSGLACCLGPGSAAASPDADYRARRNALEGLEVAIAQIQTHLGADQRVSVPAATVYPEKDVVRATGPLFDDP